MYLHLYYIWLKYLSEIPNWIEMGFIGKELTMSLAFDVNLKCKQKEKLNLNYHRIRIIVQKQSQM